MGLFFAWYMYEQGRFSLDTCMAVFHLVKKKKKKKKSFSRVNMDTSAEILCPAVCVSDRTNNAGMRGKSIKFVTSQLLSALHWVKNKPVWPHPESLNLKQEWLHLYIIFIILMKMKTKTKQKQTKKEQIFYLSFPGQLL